MKSHSFIIDFFQMALQGFCVKNAQIPIKKKLSAAIMTMMMSHLANAGKI
jgi:hypothetical protein